jgi:membrane protease YdiL (CAAX protease family)
MGDPAGPGKQYCTSCGELIDRDARYCTYCGAETTDREFPTDRSGPATASDDASFRGSTAGDADQPTAAPPASPGDGEPRPEREANEYEYHRTEGGSNEGRTRQSDEAWYWTIGVAAGLGVAGVVVLIIISIIGGGLLFSIGLPELAVLGIATAIGQYIGFMGLGTFYLQKRGYTRERILSYLGVRIPSLKEIGLVFAGWVTIFILVIIVSLIAQAFLPEPAQNEGAAQFAEGGTSLWILGAGVLFMFLVVGPCEEFLYRGIVQNRLREHISAGPAILLASAIFAVVHVVALAGDPAAMATTVGILFVPALVLGAVYEYTGNLVVPALLHGLHNSVILSVVFLGSELEESAGIIAAVLSSLGL